MSHFNQVLTEIAGELQMSNTSRNKAIVSANYLISSVYKEFKNRVESVHLFGSFIRGTNLNPRLLSGSDIDVLVVFNEDEKYLPKTYRNQLNRFVNKYYKASVVANSCPATVLSLEHIRFDITPATKVNSWFLADELYIPDGYGRWKEIDSVIDEQKLTFITSKYGQRVIDITRIFKLWNCSVNNPFKSFELEKQILSLNFKGNTLETGFVYAVEYLDANGNSKAYKSIQKLQQTVETILSLPRANKRDLIWEQMQQLFFPNR